ncbi:MAG: GNAT family N-acetyltransferase [Hyphomicrobiales bacterium]|nr:GNAT family N-acetyltransferase [Hyphomicrobiales bacterium]
MITPDIIAPDKVLPEHRQAIFRLLDAFNDERTGFPDPVTPLALLLKEPGRDAIIGGLWGVSYWNWLFVDLLIVPAAYRGQGLGTALLKGAEDKARERGCIGVWLLSFSFQAPRFYERHGYHSFGKIEDYPPGHDCTYLFKRLDLE